MEDSKKKNKENNSLSGSEAGKAQHSIIQCGRARAVNVRLLDDGGSVWRNSDI